MRIKGETKAKELHAAIDEAWERARQEATCPECDSSTNVSESGICWDCQASDMEGASD